MSLTLEEMKEKIIRFYDPDDLIETFNITTGDILDAFEERLIQRFEEFEEEFEEEEDVVY